MFQGTRNAGEPTRFGRIFKPDDAWHAKAPAEPILEPELAIVDTHHHLWDMPRFRYLLDELLADLNTGHNIVATVFEECRSMYRARGPEEMKPVGEVEFVAGVAAMSDSGRYGPARICRGIVGFADLALGDRVAAVLEAEIAAGGGRFRGIRYSAGWDADPIIGNSHGVSASGLYLDSTVRAGMKRLEKLGLVLDAWLFHPQLAEAVDLARAFPNASIVMCHMGGPLGYGPYAGKKDEVFATLEGVDDRARQVSQRVGQARRRHDAARRLRLRQAAGAAVVRGARRLLGAVREDLHRPVRSRPLHGREQLSGREDGHRHAGAVEHVQAPDRRRLGRREEGDLQRHGEPGVSAGSVKLSSRAERGTFPAALKGPSLSLGMTIEF